MTNLGSEIESPKTPNKQSSPAIVFLVPNSNPWIKVRPDNFGPSQGPHRVRSHWTNATSAQKNTRSFSAAWYSKKLSISISGNWPRIQLFLVKNTLYTGGQGGSLFQKAYQGRHQKHGYQRQWTTTWATYCLRLQLNYKQECIPVECVPAAAVAATRCQYQGVQVPTPP